MCMNTGNTQEKNNVRFTNLHGQFLATQCSTFDLSHGDHMDEDQVHYLNEICNGWQGAPKKQSKESRLANDYRQLTIIDFKISFEFKIMIDRVHI